MILAYAIVAVYQGFPTREYFREEFHILRGIKTMFWQIQFQTTCVGISISLFSRFSLSIPGENCFKPKYLHSTDAESSTAHKRDIVMTKTVFPAHTHTPI